MNTAKSPGLMVTSLIVSICVLSWSRPALYGDIVFTSGTRSVFAFTTSSSSVNSSAPGVFNETVSSSTNFGIGIASGTASQDSMTPSLIGPSMTGTGDVASLVSLNAAVGTIGVSLISSLNIQFQVDQDGLYDVQSTVAWNGTTQSNGGPGFNFASFELFDLTTSQSLFNASRDVSQQGLTSLADTINLETGHNYRIVLISRIGGGHSEVGSHSAHSSWSFGLAEASAIPEPSAINLLVLAGCLILKWRPGRAN